MPVLIYRGIVVLILPVVVGYLFSSYFLKVNLALLLDSLTGARTSTPAFSYAGTYASSNVLLTLAGTLIMLRYPRPIRQTVAGCLRHEPAGFG